MKGRFPLIGQDRIGGGEGGGGNEEETNQNKKYPTNLRYSQE